MRNFQTLGIFPAWQGGRPSNSKPVSQVQGSPGGTRARREVFGFSLIEILTAVAVLAVLGLLIAQMINATVLTTRLSSRPIDAASQARMVLDRIGLDLGAMPRRPDIDFVAANPAVGETGNEARNALLFLSLVPSKGLPVSETRGTSLVAYRVAAHADNRGRLCFQRATMALPWNIPAAWGSKNFMGFGAGGFPVKLRSSDVGFPASLIPADPDFDILAPGLIRMAVGFQLYPDGRPVTLLNGRTIGAAQGQIVYSPPRREDTGTENYVDLNRIAAIVVGVAVVDLESLRLLDDHDVLALAEHFPSLADSTDSKPPVAAWRAAAESAVQTGISKPAAEAVRVFQRFYPITPFGTKFE